MFKVCKLYHKLILLMIIKLAFADEKDLSSKKRVVGGKEALVSTHPFMASLILKKYRVNDVVVRFYGGASIVSDYWIVTAAHCAILFAEEFINAKVAYVRSNTSLWDDKGPDPRDHLIIGHIIHEKYDMAADDYDIALMKVQEPFTGKCEKPIAVAGIKYQYVAGEIATILGWGTTEADAEPFVVPQLREVDVSLMQEGHCESMLGNYGFNITPRMVCASAPGKDACVNDSGGPLIQFMDKSNVLLGIVSWGVVCASSTFPGVYTKVSVLSDWMVSKISEYHRMYDQHQPHQLEVVQLKKVIKLYRPNAYLPFRRPYIEINTISTTKQPEKRHLEKNPTKPHIKVFINAPGNRSMTTDVNGTTINISLNVVLEENS